MERTAALAKYKGKTIQITGIVRKYLRTLTGKVELLLNAPGHLLAIDCIITDPEPWNTAARGQTVTIKGTFPEEFIIPRLVDCAITEISGPNNTTMTAADLAKACDADLGGVRERYKYTCLIVSGTVADKKKLGCDVRVTLKTDSRVRVVVVLPTWRRLWATDVLAVGDAAQFVVQVLSDDANADCLEFTVEANIVGDLGK